MAELSGFGRRRFLTRTASGIAAVALAGCDRLSENRYFTNILGSAEVRDLLRRSWSGNNVLAREYGEADLSAGFRANGTTEPSDPEYRRLAESGFDAWRLQVDGLVARRGNFSLRELKEMPSRTQITRHDCVEGWSCMGKWKSARLAALLDRVGPLPEAGYVMFYCTDTMDISGTKYYESIDLEAAYHPQTILAYEMNDMPLPVAHGAPLRLRDERQLGYKMAKYIMLIELVTDFSKIGGGGGGYWEDQGYEWWAGI